MSSKIKVNWSNPFKAGWKWSAVPIEAKWFFGGIVGIFVILGLWDIFS